MTAPAAAPATAPAALASLLDRSQPSVEAPRRSTRYVSRDPDPDPAAPRRSETEAGERLRLLCG